MVRSQKDCNFMTQTTTNNISSSGPSSRTPPIPSSFTNNNNNNNNNNNTNNNYSIITMTTNSGNNSSNDHHHHHHHHHHQQGSNENNGGNGNVSGISSGGGIIGTGVTTDRTQSSTNISISSTTASQSNNSNRIKIQALKLRKYELEKMLNEKTLLLQQVQKQEAHIINGNMDNCDFIENGNSSSLLRRKIGTSFKLPKNIIKYNEETDIERLLLEKKTQQDICNLSLKISNDPTFSKSTRRSHQAEYEMAQQNLLAINQNLSILKKRQSSGGTLLKCNSLSGSATGLNSINLKSQQSNTLNDNYYNNLSNMANLNSSGSNHTFNSYYVTTSGMNSERRNSIKSTTALQLNTNSNSISNNSKDYFSKGFDKTSKPHRSDFDLNRLNLKKTTSLTPSPSSQILPIASSGPLTPENNEYLYNKSLTLQQYNKMIDEIENYNSGQHYHQSHHLKKSSSIEPIGYTKNNHGNSIYGVPTEYIKNIPAAATTTTTGLVSTITAPISPYIRNTSQNSPIASSSSTIQSDKYYFSPTQQHYDEHKGGGGFIKASQNIRQGYLEQSPHVVNSTGITPESAINKYTNDSKTIKYDYNMTDSISVTHSPPENHVSVEGQQHIPTVGLGGYWRTLPTNERVWCVVDNSNDVSNSKHLTNMKKSNLSSSEQLPKSSSISNFDTISIRDDVIDKISISSINSDTSRSKVKEKQWYETSLDGPAIRVKSQMSQYSNEYQYSCAPSSTQQLPNPPAARATTSLNYYHQASPMPSNYHSVNPSPPPPLHNSNNCEQNTSTTKNIYASQNLLQLSHSPVNNNTTISSPVRHKHHSYRERSKLSSQSMSSGSYHRITIPKLEDQSSLSHSTSVLNSTCVDTDHIDQQQNLHAGHLQMLQPLVIIAASPTIPITSSLNPEIAFQHSYGKNPQHVAGLPPIQPQSSASLRNFGKTINSNHYAHHNQHPMAMPITTRLSPPRNHNLLKLADNNMNFNNNTNNNYINLMVDKNPPSPVHSVTPATINRTNSSGNDLPKSSPADNNRIDSPKNITVVQQATYMPYKEITKPFEMSDFYKYSTKFRQKDGVPFAAGTGKRTNSSSKLPMPLPITLSNEDPA